MDDLDWLNLFRPVFMRRELRTVLWADDAAFDGMIRRAPDFHDWITRTVDVPKKPVPDFAVKGLVDALHERAEVCWRGTGFEAAFLAADGGPRIEAVAESYSGMLDALREGNGPAVIRGITSGQDIWRVRMARARARHEQSWIALEPEVAAPNMRSLHARQLEWEQATEVLRVAGWQRPALMAAWVDLEPERVKVAALQVNQSPLDSSRRPSEAAASDGAVEQRIVHALRDLGRGTPTSELVDEVADAGYPDVAASLAEIRWSRGVDVRAHRLITWLLELGDADAAELIAQEWVGRAQAANDGEAIDASMRTLEEVRAVKQLPLWTPPRVVDPESHPLDSELLSAWRRGDHRAGNLLFRRYREPLKAYIAALGAGKDADDLVQRTFLALAEEPNRLNEIRSIKSHIFRTARNVYVDWMREVGRVNLSPAPVQWSRDALDDAVAVKEFVDGLTPEEQELILLRYREGFTFGEIARVLDVPESGVRRRLALIVMRLMSLGDLSGQD